MKHRQRQGRSAPSKKHSRAARLALALIAATLVAAVVASGASALPAPVSVSITAGPPNGSTTNAQTVTFTLQAQRPNSVVVDFGCKIDGAAWDACDPVNLPTCTILSLSTRTCHQDKAYAGLAEGQHQFSVVASACNASVDDCGDPNNWVDGPEVSSSFTVDRTAPVTTFLGGPAEQATLKSGKTTFTFSANEPASFKCSVDNAAFAPCSSPLILNKLKNGFHTVAVRATDGIGNAGVAVTRGFNVKAKKAVKRCKKVRGKRKCKKAKKRKKRK